jgi:predicted nucleic acid-binding protein
MPLLLDTGVLYALADADDAWHERARHCVESTRNLLLVPVTVLPEIAYLLHARLGPRAERALVASVASGELAVEGLHRTDIERCLALLDEYPEIGFVDASLVAIAERLRLRTLATTDRRHFAAIRPRHVKAFELVP